MKYIIFFVLLFFPVNAAFGAFDVPHITVFGVATKEVVPDEIRWKLSVKTEGATALKVSKKHTDEVGQVLLVLDELGQKKNSVLTTNMQLKENWSYRNNTREKNGYYGFTEIQFITRDFSTYVDYWSRLTSLQNITVSGVTFGLSSREEIEDQVKIQAILQGKNKATALAAALGADIGKPLLVEEVDGGAQFPQGAVRAMAMESASGGRESISPGKEVVKARVKLIFVLKSD